MWLSEIVCDNIQCDNIQWWDYGQFSELSLEKWEPEVTGCALRTKWEPAVRSIIHVISYVYMYIYIYIYIYIHTSYIICVTIIIIIMIIIIIIVRLPPVVKTSVWRNGRLSVQKACWSDNKQHHRCVSYCWWRIIISYIIIYL